MIEIAGATKELVPPRADVAKAPLPDWTERWALLTVLRAQWSTLALVATDAGAPCPALATALAEMTRAYGLRPVRALYASGASAPEIALVQEEVAASRAGEARLVIAMDDPRAEPACVPLLAQLDAALLLVRIGASEIRAVEEIIALVGRERVIGCVVAR
jgi:hypothetical protein